ncbi:hypothetical protein MRX96_047671 [Rhipicephalus microplus]
MASSGKRPPYKHPELAVDSMPQNASVGGHEQGVLLGHPPLINQQIGPICERLMNERNRRLREGGDEASSL